jgi:hypothetical protein
VDEDPYADPRYPLSPLTGCIIAAAATLSAPQALWRKRHRHAGLTLTLAFIDHLPDQLRAAHRERRVGAGLQHVAAVIGEHPLLPEAGEGAAGHAID